MKVLILFAQFARTLVLYLIDCYFCFCFSLRLFFLFVIFHFENFAGSRQTANCVVNKKLSTCSEKVKWEKNKQNSKTNGEKMLRIEEEKAKR